MQNYFLSIGATIVLSLSALFLIRPSPNVNIVQTAEFSPFALVELFTSEGCSSCPPADQVLSDLVDQAKKEDKAVYALSFHVDYWNYLGWKDPFSDASFSKRQRAYASALRSQVYTPQMVVNGVNEFVGSRRSEANAAVKEALDQKAIAKIELELASASENKVELNYTVENAPKDAIIHFALAERQIKIDVNRGENRGRSLEHDNVVRAFNSLGLPKNANGQSSLNIPANINLSNCSVIAYVQKGNTGAILAAKGIYLE